MGDCPSITSKWNPLRNTLRPLFPETFSVFWSDEVIKRQFLIIKKSFWSITG
jgi:hypothetical protein